jgi:hypothetical protein
MTERVNVLRLLNDAPRPYAPEVNEALEAYVQADKANAKAYDSWRIAEQRLIAREEALERAVNAARSPAPGRGRREAAAGCPGRVH